MRVRLLALCCVAALATSACTSDSGGSSSDTAGKASDSSPSSTTKDVAAEPSPGCDARPAVTPGEEKVSLTSGGVERWYFQHVPPQHTGTKPVPVVLDLHGYVEGAYIHTMMSDLGAYGDEKGFVTVTPQGLGTPARWDLSFSGDDMTFVGELLDDVERSLCVDERRVYVTGLSFGGFMTSAISCAHADRIAAAAPVAGIGSLPGCKPSRPVPVIAFHGTADPIVSYQGGLGEGAADLPSFDGSGRKLGDAGSFEGKPTGPTVPEVTAAWAKRNSCAATPTEKQVAADVTLIRYQCAPDATVELYSVIGGGHAWPGSTFSKAIAGVIGKTTSSISANELMWTFFRNHPLPVNSPRP